MAKPTIYFQGSNAGGLPSQQQELRWNYESEIGTVLTGDGNSTGIFMGALTNAQYSDDFDIIITHDAQEPITGVQFYFQPTTNVRTGGTGFTSSDDVDGANTDFEEMRQWGTDSFNAETGTSTVDGMYLIFKDETEDATNCQFRENYMDSLANSKPLTLDGKPNGTGTGDVINAFDGYSGGDYAWIKTRLFVPESLEDAGKRQIALYTRLTYTF
jgi:hypothetical protein